MATDTNVCASYASDKHQLKKTILIKINQRQFQEDIDIA